MNEFVVQGTRPASALASHRSNSSSRKINGYHILAKPSYVDESLFGSQHHTKLDEQLKDFKAPWEYPKPPTPRRTFGEPPKTKTPVKSEHKGRPLLWCPTPNAAAHTQQSIRAKVTTPSGTQSVGSPTPADCLWNTRDRFRRLKHTPTFVDESLFGPRLQEPTFEAPWNERKKGEKKPIRPYLFDPSGGSTVGHGELSSGRSKPRPATALGISRAMKRRRTSGEAPPVWKP